MHTRAEQLAIEYAFEKLNTDLTNGIQQQKEIKENINAFSNLSMNTKGELEKLKSKFKLIQKNQMHNEEEEYDSLNCKINIYFWCLVFENSI